MYSPRSGLAYSVLLEIADRDKGCSAPPGTEEVVATGLALGVGVAVACGEPAAGGTSRLSNVAVPGLATESQVPAFRLTRTALTANGLSVLAWVVQVRPSGAVS